MRTATAFWTRIRIAYSITVAVANVVLTVENAGGAAGAVPLTECMAGRHVTFTATTSDNIPCGWFNSIQFTFHYQHADGTLWTDTEWSTSHVADSTAVADQVPAGTADHKFTTPIYAVASKNGMSCTSNTLNIDVHELWIKTFQDAGTGRAWRVCIASNISYEAYASSDCTSWSWQMPDGIFSCAWNPTGGNTKSGTSMQIPNSDKARASNSWFGTAYGTVYVYCVDGGMEMVIVFTRLRCRPRRKRRYTLTR